MSADSRAPVPFQAHVELLRALLAHRRRIVDRIQDLLNAQRKPAQVLQDRSLLSHHLDDCFFAEPSIPGAASRSKHELDEAHWASGFKPRQLAGLHNDLIDPAEMLVRAFFFWQQTRWPGRNGRARFAETLFNLYLLRRLELLSMRLWDDVADTSTVSDSDSDSGFDAGASAGARLAQLQGVLDALRQSQPSDQPVIVRDARWLIPLAQSPNTEELAAYFDVAERVAEALPEADRLEAQKAHVLMIGGHLRSQIRHYSLSDGVSIDAPSVVQRTRTSNALDFALLIQNLVPLLEAYERAAHAGDERHRVELADTILQGISPDPELLLNRIDLLGAYSMIEHLFVRPEPENQAVRTAMGARQLRLFEEYGSLIARVSGLLRQDYAQFRPLDGSYSPYGAIYGNPTNLMELIAFKVLQPDADMRFGLEDVFTGGSADTGKLAWVNGWRRLPYLDPAVQKRYDYPQRFAEDIFDRIERALRHHAAAGRGADDATADDVTVDITRTGRLHITSEDQLGVDPALSRARDLPAKYVVSSDPQIVAAGKAGPADQTQLLRDRQEGHFIVSYETSAGWVAISKDFLTDELGAGRDVRIVDLPPAAAGVLRLMCPRLAQ